MLEFNGSDGLSGGGKLGRLVRAVYSDAILRHLALEALEYLGQCEPFRSDDAFWERVAGYCALDYTPRLGRPRGFTYGECLSLPPEGE